MTGNRPGCCPRCTPFRQRSTSPSSCCRTPSCCASWRSTPICWSLWRSAPWPVSSCVASSVAHTCSDTCSSGGQRIKQLQRQHIKTCRKNVLWLHAHLRPQCTNKSNFWQASEVTAAVKSSRRRVIRAECDEMGAGEGAVGGTCCSE